MDKQGCQAPATMTELFKLLRSQWLSRKQISAETGLCEATTMRWVNELACNGMLRDKTGEPSGQGGRTPQLYSLAPEWGGSAPSAAGASDEA